MATIPEAMSIAIQHHNAGRLQAAEQIYRHILIANPNQPEAWHFLGVLACQLGRHEVASDYIGRAIRLNGTKAEFHNNLGIAFKNQGKLDEAAASYYLALELDPGNIDAHNNLGNLLKGLGKLDEALTCYLRALELKPDFAEAHNNLGLCFREQGRLDEAVTSCQRALELKPDYPDAHNNLGYALQEQGKLNEALACYRTAVVLNPNFAQAHINRAHVWLLSGDWQRGWPEYEWRWQATGLNARRFSQPVWYGESLAEKTIFIHAEQGLGDTIQFIRYASLVKQRGAKVILGCPNPLVRLLEGMPDVDLIIGDNDVLPAFDVHVPLLSLPGILKTTIETIPARVPYLIPNPAHVEQWQMKLEKFDGFRIGIIWQGNPRFDRPDCRAADRRRSFSLAQFEPLARLPGVRLFSLQKGFGTEQLAQWGPAWGIIHLGDHLNDFTDTAAVMMNLDLIISADTSPAHLAGALGRTVWTALPFAGCWRWLERREDSPWYPTMRLFRQDQREAWGSVFERIATALSDLVANRTAGIWPHGHNS